MTPVSAQDLLNLGYPEQLWLVFIAGIFTSVTPCVYPLIPVTVAIFAGQKETSRLTSFLLSLTYTLGIATTYTILGLTSAYTGALFGSLLGNPTVSLIISILLIILALSSLDIIRLQFGTLIQQRVSKLGGGGFVGAFIMGLVSGIIAAPCTGPVLAAILIVAASSADPLQGAGLLFVHALGLGSIFILIGTWRGALSIIPRSGNWLAGTKLLLSSAILIVSWMFLAPFLRHIGLGVDNYFHLIVLAVAIISSAMLGLIAVGQDIGWLKLVSVVFISTTLFGATDLLSFSKISETKPTEDIVWSSNLDMGMDRALREGRIAMVDLFAEWCGACKEFERVTFKDPRVASYLKNKLTPIRLDFTIPDENSDLIEQEFKIIGLPTILFLDNNGAEIPNSRVTGFLDPDEFMKHLEKIIPQ
jgi:thiol:disulfide interchange protein DsbD